MDGVSLLLNTSVLPQKMKGRCHMLYGVCFPAHCKKRPSEKRAAADDW